MKKILVSAVFVVSIFFISSCGSSKPCGLASNENKKESAELYCDQQKIIVAENTAE